MLLQNEKQTTSFAYMNNAQNTFKCKFVKKGLNGEILKKKSFQILVNYDMKVLFMHYHKYQITKNNNQ